MKKLLAKIAMLATLVAPLAMPIATHAASPTWDATGTFIVNMEYLGPQYAHDMSLTQDGLGNLTGFGGNPVGANVYTWVITSGTVSGNSIDF